MEVRTLKFGDVVEAFYNPRKHLKKTDKAYADIKNSIETYGVVEPMVVNEVTMRLVSGHQRMQVLRDLGFKEGEFSIVHIEDPTEEKALNISLNKIKGKFDNTKLYDVLREIKDDIDITELGFEMDEIENILGESNDEDPLEEGGDIELDERPLNTKVSSVLFRLGKSLTYNVSAEDYREIERSCIEAGCFTDLEIAQELKNRLLYDKVNQS